MAELYKIESVDSKFFEPINISDTAPALILQQDPEEIQAIIKKLIEIKAKTGSAAWFVAKCIEIPPGTQDNSVLGKVALVYFALDEQDKKKAKVGKGIKCGAPCPPFGHT